MKVKNILLSGILFSSIFVIEANAGAFTMTCRSGGSMSLMMQPSQWVKKSKMPMGIDSRKDGYAFELSFLKSKKSVNQQKPHPGRCAWQHRPLNKKEKKYAYLNTKKVTQISARVTAKGDRILDKNLSSDFKKLLKYVRKPNTVFSMVVNKHGLIEKVF